MVAKKIVDRIKGRFKEKNFKADRKLIVFLVFVVLSTIFWFLNQLEEEYVTDIKLPVRYQNFPSDKILVNELPKHFDLRVRGYGFKLLEYKISNKFLPYTVNVNSVTLRMQDKENYTKFFALTRLLNNDIEEQISSELDVVSIEPDTLFFDLAERIFKKVPVISKLNVVTSAQYMMRGNVEFNPDSVTISGAYPVVDTIEQVFTKKVDFLDLSANIEDDVKLEKISLIDYSEDEVGVIIEVEKFTEASQKIPLNIINSPDSIVVRTFPKEIEITYFVALSDYDKVVPQLFEAVVDYNDINNQENKLSIHIVNSPDYIQSIRYRPKSVEYIIEKRE